MCLIFSHIITPRLKFVSDFIGKEICGKAFDITSDVEAFINYYGPKINYSHQNFPDSLLSIVHCPLLFESGLSEQTISCFEVNSYKAFFKTEGDYPFDIFAASFYLLSRYEEYLPHSKDSYGRYSHENSLAFKEGFLNLPLVNIWLTDFKKVLKEKFPSFTIHHSPKESLRTQFTFQPTYDIDEAYAYKHKGFLRTIGGHARAKLSGEWFRLIERPKVLLGKKQDPYDAYQWMDDLHKEHKLQPIYFFLVAEKNGKYDKNILPSHPAMQQLIKQQAEKYQIGLHPSWQSGDDVSLLEKELKTLVSATGRKVSSSRQHYIRFMLPDTFRQLIKAGITDDYSMGYGSINGFRASVASSFYWYDLEKEQTTNLLLHPFCYMEANSFFEQKYSAQHALEEIQHYYQVVKSVNGTLISIWHNSFLGTEKKFAGWREVYEEFISGV